MAKKQKVSPRDIKPTQNFMTKMTIEFIKKCIEEERLEDLPPTPIVTEVKGELVAIDGHNLLTVYDEMNKELDVYVVNAADDVPEDLKDTPREQELSTKFPYIEKMYDKVQVEGITSFSKLRLKGNMQ